MIPGPAVCQSDVLEIRNAIALLQYCEQRYGLASPYLGRCIETLMRIAQQCEQLAPARQYED